MKFNNKTVQNFAVLATLFGAVFMSGCATLDQNMVGIGNTGESKQTSWASIPCLEDFALWGR